MRLAAAAAMSVSVLSAVLWASVPARAQESNTLILEGDAFVERFEAPTQFNRVPVAGLYVHAKAGAAQPVIRVVVEKDTPVRTYCVRTITADGFYESVNTFRLRDDYEGPVGEILIDTTRPDEVGGLDATQLGVAVFEGACESGQEGRKILPAFWNADPASATGTATLAVNSMRAERVFIYVGEDRQAAACRPAEGEVRHNFDTLCEVDLALLAEGEETTIGIVAIADQMPRPEETVIVRRAPLQPGP